MTLQSTTSPAHSLALARCSLSHLFESLCEVCSTQPFEISKAHLAVQLLLPQQLPRVAVDLGLDITDLHLLQVDAHFLAVLCVNQLVSGSVLNGFLSSVARTELERQSGRQ